MTSAKRLRPMARAVGPTIQSTSGLPRASVETLLSTGQLPRRPGSVRHSLTLVAVCVIEAVLIVGLVSMIVGIGYEGPSSPKTPEPAPTPMYQTLGSSD
jgi:hypothetical protein